MPLKIDTEQEEDGRWITEILDLPGVLTYRSSREEAIMSVQALALRVLADRIEHCENGPRMLARVAKSTGLSPEDLCYLLYRFENQMLKL